MGTPIVIITWHAVKYSIVVRGGGGESQQVSQSMPNMNLLDPEPSKGTLSPKRRCTTYDRGSSEGFYGVSVTYVRSLKGSQKAG